MVGEPTSDLPRVRRLFCGCSASRANCAAFAWRRFSSHSSTWILKLLFATSKCPKIQLNEKFVISSTATVKNASSTITVPVEPISFDERYGNAPPSTPPYDGCTIYSSPEIASSNRRYPIEREGRSLNCAA